MFESIFLLNLQDFFSFTMHDDRFLWGRWPTTEAAEERTGCKVGYRGFAKRFVPWNRNRGTLNQFKYSLCLYYHVKVELSKQVVCDRCRGTGAKSPEDVVCCMHYIIHMRYVFIYSPQKKCKKCKGSGIVITQHKLGPGFVQQVQSE